MSFLGSFTRRSNGWIQKMSLFNRNRPLLPPRAREYASAGDFCRIFGTEMTSLYCLALALTADEELAEQCFVTGLEECISGNAVFKEWARGWSKRVVIKKAIQLVSPVAGVGNHAPPACVPGDPGSGAALVLAALGRLQPFDRFVFVMSVLEGYSNHECSALLACTPGEVARARIRGLEEIQEPHFSFPIREAGFSRSSEAGCDEVQTVNSSGMPEVA
jgi:DNA-directed RNA polymerase specialized sigma24 family protein